MIKAREKINGSNVEVLGNGGITQLDRSKTRYRCRKWRLQIYVCQNGETIRKTKRFTGSYNEAKEALYEFIDEVENSYSITDGSLNAVAEEWLEARRGCKSFSSNTIASNERNIRKLIRMFGNIKLSQITPRMIRHKIYNLKNELTGEDVTNQHKGKLLLTLSQIFDFAISERIVGENPTKTVQKPSERADNIQKIALTKDEFNQTIECLDKANIDGRKVALLTIMYLGLRRSEVCALKWKDYNSEKRELSIQRAFKDGDCTVGETKSASSKRVLPMPAQLCDLYDNWKEVYGVPADDESFICLNYNGNLLRGVVLRHYWKKFAEKNNLHYVSLHELRHTNLTFVARKMSPFDLKNWAGWSDLSPARIYIHEDKSAMRFAIDNTF